MHKKISYNLKDVEKQAFFYECKYFHFPQTLYRQSDTFEDRHLWIRLVVSTSCLIYLYISQIASSILLDLAALDTVNLHFFRKAKKAQVLPIEAVEPKRQ